MRPSSRTGGERDRRKGHRPEPLRPQETPKTEPAASLPSQIADQLIEAAFDEAPEAGFVSATQQALQQSEARFKSLYESVHAGVIVQQADGRIIHANRMACEIFRMSEEEIRSRTSMDAGWQMILENGTPVAGEDHPSMITLRSGLPIRDVVRGLFANDPSHLQWLLINSEPLRRQPDGAVEEVLITFQDITRLKAAERELQAAHQFLRTVLDSFPGNVAVLAEDGSIVMFNSSWRAFGEANGIAAEFLREGVNYLDVCRMAKGPWSREAPQAAEAIAALLDGRRRSFEMEYPCHSPNERRWFSLQGQGFTYDGVRWAVLAHLNITDRRQAEEALRQSEQKYRTVVENAKEGILVLQDHRRAYYNRRWLEITGYGASEYDATAFLSLLHPDDYEPIARVCEEVVGGREVEAPQEFRIITRSGQTRWLSVRVSRIEWEDRPAAMIFVEDVTARKETEQRLMHYQGQLRSLSSELALTEERERRRIGLGVHDHIGQPLVMIKFAVQSLGMDTDETTGRKLCEIRGQIDELLEAIRSLSFELGDSVLYEVGFKEATEAYAMREIQQKHGIVYQVDAQEDFPRLPDDVKVVLFRNLRELLANVVKHARAKHVGIRLTATAEALTVEVKDDGVGFDPTAVYEEHGQRHFGIFSVREQLGFLGGRLEIDSAPGGGAVLTMILPRPGEWNE